MNRFLSLFAVAALVLGGCKQANGPIRITCKPTVLNIPGPQYDFFYHLRRNSLQARIGWDTSGRPISMEALQEGKPDRSYAFDYDTAGNLTRVNVKDVTDSLAPSLVFRWPSNARGSIAPECWVKLGQDPELNYRFNAAHQLQEIRTGDKTLERLYYDETGNLTIDSLFDLNGAARSFFQYDQYDGKPNPGLAHRSLQLFLQMYSRNNPTSMSRNLIAIGISATGYARTYDGKAEYTYNEEGLPLTMNGGEYGVYACPKN